MPLLSKVVTGPSKGSQTKPLFHLHRHHLSLLVCFFWLPLNLSLCVSTTDSFHGMVCLLDHPWYGQACPPLGYFLRSKVDTEWHLLFSHCFKHTLPTYSNTIQYNTIQYNTIQYNTIQSCSVVMVIVVTLSLHKITKPLPLPLPFLPMIHCSNNNTVELQDLHTYYLFVLISSLRLRRGRASVAAIILSSGGRIFLTRWYLYDTYILTYCLSHLSFKLLHHHAIYMFLFACLICCMIIPPSSPPPCADLYLKAGRMSVIINN
jgi:hypothetical protein